MFTILVDIKNGNNYDFVVNYTLDNRISIIGKVDGDNITKSGPLLVASPEDDAYFGASDYKGERLTDYLLLMEREYDTATSNAGVYEYVILNNQKVYLDYDRLNDVPPALEGDDFNVKYGGDVHAIATDTDPANYKDKLKLFFRYSSNYTKDYVNSPSDVDTLCSMIKIGEDGKGHLYSDSAQKYYESGKAFTDWVVEKLGNDITQENAIDAEGNPMYVPDPYYCKFVTDLTANDGKIFNISEDNNPLLPNSAFNEHRISVIRYSIETNLSSAMASYISEANVGYEYAMPVFSEDDWNKIENNVCVSSFLQGMPVGAQIYDKYFVLSNNANEDAVDLESVFAIASITKADGLEHIEYHKPGCKELIDAINNGSAEIIGFYQSSDFKRKTISVSGDDINALSQLNRTEGSNFNYYYFHQMIDKEKIDGACYDCIVNGSTAYSSAELIQGRYYNYDEHRYKTDMPNTSAYRDYITRYKIALYRIRNNAYMINGYFGT